MRWQRTTQDDYGTWEGGQRILLANLEQRPHGGLLCGEPPTSGVPDRPGGEAREMEGRRYEGLLHVHGGVPSGACVTKTTNSDSVRKGVFTTCLLMVLRPPLRVGEQHASPESEPVDGV